MKIIAKLIRKSLSALGVTHQEDQFILSDDHKPFIIVGLGNPGSQYKGTPHNVGFECVDQLAQKWHADKWSKKFHAKTTLIHQVPGHEGLKVLLVKPQTYMNLSGKSVQGAVTFYKAPLSTHLLVIVDDLDLPLGQIRIRKAGGSGGHNGLNSIIECLGNKQFMRMRIGIGRSEEVPTKNYILSKISNERRKVLDRASEEGVKAIEMLLAKGIDAAMNEFNRKKESNESKE